jgi:hypothetical protein
LKQLIVVNVVSHKISFCLKIKSLVVDKTSNSLYEIDFESKCSWIKEGDWSDYLYLNKTDCFLWISVVVEIKKGNQIVPITLLI